MDQTHAEMTRWRHALHRHPELGFEETRTAALVADQLRAFGLDVTEGVGGTGVVGVLGRGTSDRAIGLRADMDALAIAETNAFDHRSQVDGRMHACGHDGHTAMLLGAARCLSTAENLDGTVVFIFQPAEEHGRGALAMMEDGLFARFPVDAVFAMHNLPGLAPGRIAVRPGPVMACEDTFTIDITGRGGHAAMPHRTVDPIVVGAEVVGALQTIVSRGLDPATPAVVSVTDFQVAGTRNVIPGAVRLTGDCRAFRPETQDAVEAAMRRLAAGVCAAHGAEAAVTYTREFAATINTAAEAELAARVAEETLGAGCLAPDAVPLLASEDFGFMLQRKPGAYLLIGNGGDAGQAGCGLHGSGYDFNDAILPTGAAYWCALARTFLGGPSC